MRLLVTKPAPPARAVPSLRFLSLNLRGKIKQVRAHTRASGERENRVWPVYLGDRSRDGTERDGECQVCHASETFAMRFIAARDCVPIQLCAREWRLRKRLCVQGLLLLLLDYCLLQTRRDARCCMQRMRRVLLALIRRPLEGRLLARHSQGSLSSTDRPNLHTGRNGNQACASSAMVF